MFSERFILAFLIVQATLTSDVHAETITPLEPVPAVETDSPTNDFLVAGVSLGVAAGLLSGGAIAWWSDNATQPFHLRYTGLFEEENPTGGSDKLGHVFSSYATTIGFAKTYQQMGMRKTNRILLASAVTALVGTSVELIDGFTEYGFDYMDGIANLLGIGIAALELLDPKLDDAIGIRMGYMPSPRFVEKTKLNFINTVNDYSGMIYYGDINAGGMARLLGLSLPRYSDFILFGVNYGTWEYDPTGPLEDKRRRMGFHVALSLNEVFESLMEPSIWRTGIAGFFDFYAPPFTTLQRTHDHNTGCNQTGFGLNGRAMTPACD